MVDTGLAEDVLDLDSMWEALAARVLHRNGRQRVPIPAGIGHCVFLNDIDKTELAAAMAVVCTFLGSKNAAVIEY